MRRVGTGRALWLIVAVCLLLVLLPALPASAQSGARVAFVNTSGQLVIGSADGSYRWIVTNPGEVLVQPVGFTWSPDGRSLFLAVNNGAGISLRFADPAAQSVTEAAQSGASAITGGGWTRDGRGVMVSDGNSITFIGRDGSIAPVVTGQSGLSLFSPYGDARPNLPGARSVSGGNTHVFFQQGDGRYAVAALDGSSAFPLPGSNEQNARASGLWADNAPLVAYWGYEGSAILSVTNATNGQTLTLNSGRTAPITPVLWLPNTTVLLYRDASGVVRAADMACLASSCSADPLQSGLEVLPPTATEIVLSNGALYYQDGTSIMALNSACISSGACAGSAMMVAANAAPSTMISAAGNVLFFTGFSANPNDVNDRSAQVVVVNGCQFSGGCTVAAAIPSALSGTLSADGSAALYDSPAAGGLFAVSLTSGANSYLADSMGAPGLALARWGG